MLNSKLEYDWHPWPEFVSSKGRFRLSGSDSDGYDEYKELGTANFHRWKRSDILGWIKSGKIKPYNEISVPHPYESTKKKKKNRLQPIISIS